MNNEFAETLANIGKDITDPSQRELFLNTAKTAFPGFLESVATGLQGLAGEDVQAELQEEFDAEMKAVSEKDFRGQFVPLYKQNEIRTKYRDKGLRGVSY